MMPPHIRRVHSLITTARDAADFKVAATMVREVIMSGVESNHEYTSWLCSALAYKGHHLIQGLSARQRASGGLISAQVVLTYACEPVRPLERESVEPLYAQLLNATGLDR